MFFGSGSRSVCGDKTSETSERLRMLGEQTGCGNFRISAFRSNCLCFVVRADLLSWHRLCLPQCVEPTSGRPRGTGGAPAIRPTHLAAVGFGRSSEDDI